MRGKELSARIYNGMSHMSYLAPLDERRLCSLHKDPVILLQSGSVDIHYTWNVTHTIERETKMWVLAQHIPLLTHILMLDNAAFPK